MEKGTTGQIFFWGKISEETGGAFLRPQAGAGFWVISSRHSGPSTWSEKPEQASFRSSVRVAPPAWFSNWTTSVARRFRRKR